MTGHCVPHHPCAPTKAKSTLQNSTARSIKDVSSHLSTNHVNRTQLTRLLRAINKAITTRCQIKLTSLRIKHSRHHLISPCLLNINADIISDKLVIELD